MFEPHVTQMLVKGVWESLYMVFSSTFLAYVFGLPLGVLLVLTARDGILPNRAVSRGLDTAVNLMRSVPFLILMVCIIPLTRKIVGTSIGSTATIVPLTISAAPFIARMVESSLLEVDHGVIEAAQSMGASPFQIVYKVLLPEASPSLINGCAIAITTILGYSAMAGAVGGGGLGNIAISYGYNRRQTDIMAAAVVLLVVLVQVFQLVGGFVSRRIDKR